MQRKIICYFETEAQCEAAVSALCCAKIDAEAIRIVSESTKNTDGFKLTNGDIIGSSAPIALTDGYQNQDSTPNVLYQQAPVATLLIRGDLFTFTKDQTSSIGNYAVEVCGNKETLELAKDILLNLF